MDSFEFRIAAALLLISFIVHRGYYTRKVQHAQDEVVEQPDLGILSQIAGVLGLPTFLVTMIYVFVPTWIAWFALPFPIWMRWLGLVIALGGFGLLQWSQHTLSTNWSDTPIFAAGQQLVTAGPYGRIRHPIYTGFLLILGSLLLISANWLVGLLWIGMTSLDITARVNAEEQLMIEQFGDRYRQYMQQTGRLFPR